MTRTNPTIRRPPTDPSPRSRAPRSAARDVPRSGASRSDVPRSGASRLPAVGRAAPRSGAPVGTAAGTTPGRSRWPTVARIGAWAVAVVTVAVVMFVFVFPTRTYLDQRHQLHLAAERLRILDQQNAALSARADTLRSDAEIERLARERYHLVRPGEQAFGILPAPDPAPTTPAPPPASRGAGGALWHRLTTWLP